MPLAATCSRASPSTSKSRQRDEDCGGPRKRSAVFFLSTAGYVRRMEQARKLEEQADRAAAAGQFGAARSLLEQAVEADGASLGPWVKLSAMCRASGDLPGALTAIERALAISPLDFPAPDGACRGPRRSRRSGCRRGLSTRACADSPRLRDPARMAGGRSRRAQAVRRIPRDAGAASDTESARPIYLRPSGPALHGSSPIVHAGRGTIIRGRPIIIIPVCPRTNFMIPASSPAFASSSKRPR